MLNDAGSAAPEVKDKSRFICETGLAASLAALIEPVLEDLGFRLVRVTVSGRDGKTVQIMAERPDGTITIDDCETISRQLSPLLDANELVSGSYRLEVSSPGIDRPLVRLTDFEDWAGHEAKVELKEPVDGKKRYRGRLDGIEDGEVRMEVEIEEMGRVTIGFPASLINEARLVLTDELIRDALTRAKKRGYAAPGDGSDADDFEVEED